MATSSNNQTAPLDKVREILRHFSGSSADGEFGDQALSAIQAVVLESLPEEEKETWMNKYLVNTELKWALKALPEMYKRGKNATLSDIREKRGGK